MRTITNGLVAGSLAFGLVAAAATGTAFTLNAAGIPGTDKATALLNAEYCDGTYEIEWVTSSGALTGFTATRTAPAAEDTNLEYCAEMPYELTIAGMSESTGITDQDGNISDTLSSPLVTDNDEVALEIGPDAGL